MNQLKVTTFGLTLAAWISPMSLENLLPLAIDWGASGATKLKVTTFGLTITAWTAAVSVEASNAEGHAD